MKNLMNMIKELGSKKFLVRFYEGIENYELTNEQEITYFELGTILLTKKIERIDIIEG